MQTIQYLTWCAALIWLLEGIYIGTKNISQDLRERAFRKRMMKELNKGDVGCCASANKLTPEEIIKLTQEAEDDKRRCDA